MAEFAANHDVPAVVTAAAVHQSDGFVVVAGDAMCIVAVRAQLEGYVTVSANSRVSRVEFDTV